jgi:hypothetical protein
LFNIAQSQAWFESSGKHLQDGLCYELRGSGLGSLAIRRLDEGEGKEVVSLIFSTNLPIVSHNWALVYLAARAMQILSIASGLIGLSG